MRLDGRAILWIWILLLSGFACDRGEQDQSAPDPHDSSKSPTAAASRPSGVPRVVFLGDSITAGLGLSAEEAFPALIEQMLRDEGIEADVVNAGVSGDTTAGGLRRLDWLLRQSPAVIVVGLGGNDGLRGLDVPASRENLASIIRKSREAGAKVLLLGMMMPPNYGPDYTREFREAYPQIARELDVPLVPFLLEGVGGERDLNQPDGIHPNAEGHRVIARNILPHLRDVLRRLPTTRASAGGQRALGAAGSETAGNAAAP